MLTLFQDISKPEGSTKGHLNDDFTVSGSSYLLIIFLCLVPMALLFIALLRLQYSYYVLLRIIVFICSLLIFFSEFRELKFWAICFGCIAILYNPIFPIHLSREKWKVFNIVSALMFLFEGIRLYLSEIESLKMEKLDLQISPQEVTSIGINSKENISMKNSMTEHTTPQTKQNEILSSKSKNDSNLPRELFVHQYGSEFNRTMLDAFNNSHSKKRCRWKRTNAEIAQHLRKKVYGELQKESNENRINERGERPKKKSFFPFRLLSHMPNLKLREGYQLDYVYYIDCHYGHPYVFSRRKSGSGVTIEEYFQQVKTYRGLLRKKIEKIQFDSQNDQSCLELVLFLLYCDQFDLQDHSFYGKWNLVFSPEHLPEELNNAIGASIHKYNFLPRMIKSEEHLFFSCYQSNHQYDLYQTNVAIRHSTLKKGYPTIVDMNKKLVFHRGISVFY